MRFRLLDRITEVDEGKKIRATIRVRGDEDYLRDHFPNFPVMPGVLMMEAGFQAASWLIRKAEDFQPTIHRVQEVRSAKFADFVQPHQELEITAEWAKSDSCMHHFKVLGTKSNALAFSTRMVIASHSIIEYAPEFDDDRRYFEQQLRGQFDALAG